MKKYDLSAIMKNAWNLFRKYNANLGRNREGKKIIHWPFSVCLKRAWTEAKEAVKAAVSGIKRMHYGEYKRNYAGCKTVPGSYDKITKTIEVITNTIRAPKIRYNGICPRCHTYCYGDCIAH